MLKTSSNEGVRLFLWLEKWMDPDMVVALLVVGSGFVAMGAACTLVGSITFKRKPITRKQLNAANRRLEQGGLIEGHVGNSRQAAQLRQALAPLEIIHHRGDRLGGFGAVSSSFGAVLVLVGTATQILYG